MYIIFSVMIKDWMFTRKCYGRDDTIASWGKRQKNDKCWSKVWLWYTIIWKWKLLSHVQLFGTLWTVAYQAPLSMEFSRPEYWPAGSCFLLQGIFPTWYLTQVSLIAGRFFTIWATREAQEYWSGQLIPSPGESSRSRNQAGICCIAGGFFTSWGMREVPIII